jgi:hypothetical protein
LGVIVLGLVGLAAAAYVGIIPTAWGAPASPEVAAAVATVIRQSIRTNYEVAHTLDTTPLATIYANDPRGGPLDASIIAFIRAAHPDDPRPPAALGWLDYQEALYARQIAGWADTLAQLRSKQAAGILTNDEQQILNVVDGTHLTIASATPPLITPPPTLSPAMIATQMAAAYPPGYLTPTRSPTLTAAPPPWEVAYPGYEPPPTVDAASFTPPAPTAVPTAVLPFHDPDPASLPPEMLAVTVLTVRVKDGVVKAVVEWRQAVIEYRLVSLAGQWYIVGETILKRGPCCG